MKQCQIVCIGKCFEDWEIQIVHINVLARGSKPQLIPKELQKERSFSDMGTDFVTSSKGEILPLGKFYGHNLL